MSDDRWRDSYDTMAHPDDIITQADRDLLAAAYEERCGDKGSYPTYADLARRGDGAFTRCSLRAIARAREEGRRAAGVRARSDADA